jgi:hypothetical protein
MKQGRSVWIVGLDAADHRLIERWAGERLLPSFCKLLDQGTYGLLESTADLFSGSAWVSIGGVYSRYQLVNGTYDIRRIRAGDCKVGPFWSDFAGPMVLVDIPKVSLSDDVDGVQIVEWGAYDHYAAFASTPVHISNEIVCVILEATPSLHAISRWRSTRAAILAASKIKCSRVCV